MPSSRPRALSDPFTSCSRQPSADLVRHTPNLTPVNGPIPPEPFRRRQSTSYKIAGTSASEEISKHAAELKRSEVKQMEIAASKYQRQHDMGLAKMRYKLKKRRLGLLERKRVDRRERHAHDHKKRMAKIKLRRLEVELRHARAELFKTHGERMAELQAKMLEVELRCQARTKTTKLHRGWTALVPPLKTLSQIGRAGSGIKDALRLVQDIQADVPWVPRVASDLKRWLRRSG